MNIIVCIKQVPDTTEIKIDPEKGTLKREGVPSIMNPDDKHALVEAIKLKGDGKITVISMGPPQAEEALREALAYGADEAILLTDRQFAAADTMATSYTLAKAIEKVGNYDLIFCGRQAIDGDTAQIGPQIAEILNIPQITYAQKISAATAEVEVERQTEYGHDVVTAKLPALITVVKELNNPDYPTLKGLLSAYREKEVTVRSAADIGADPEKIGFKGSPTWVKKSFTPSQSRAGEILTPDKSRVLATKLMELSGK